VSVSASRLPVLGWAGLIAIIASFILLARMGLSGDQIVRGFGNLGILAGEAFPPRPELMPVALRALGETLAMAFLGTLYGFLLALPIGLAGARTLSPTWLLLPARALAAAVRSLPALLWAVLFVILLGFGPVAGIFAMTMYTMGHLAKLQYESLEGLAPEAFEAVRATGASRLQVARFVALPEASNLLLSQLLYMFEYNVRASSIVGFVGAGGIGYYINLYLRALQYNGVVTLLLVVFATVVVIDVASLHVRSRFLTALPGN
jgi:phosphonate transport system permease protein